MKTVDPITQGLLGAAASHAACGKTLERGALVVGAAAGLLADVDVFIPYDASVLGNTAIHRHFTHALVFIPMGGLIAALLLGLFPRFRKRWLLVLGAATLGYATHGLLDALTSYGTLLLWPFSNQRISWDAISIVDAAFTLPLAVGVTWAAVAKNRWPVFMALTLCAAYVALGFYQHHRAAEMQQQLAKERGHTIERGRAMPALGTVRLWRSLYQHGGMLYADGIEVPLFGKAQVDGGEATPVFDLSRLSENMRGDGALTKHLQEFAWFADGFLAFDPNDSGLIADMRYSRVASGFQPLWGIRIHPNNPDAPLAWVRRRPPRSQLTVLNRLLALRWTVQSYLARAFKATLGERGTGSCKEQLC